MLMDRISLAVTVDMRDFTHAGDLRPETCTSSCALCTQLYYIAPYFGGP